MSMTTLQVVQKARENVKKNPALRSLLTSHDLAVQTVHGCVQAMEAQAQLLRHVLDGDKGYHWSSEDHLVRTALRAMMAQAVIKDTVVHMASILNLEY